jgi:hypothetical protein
VLLVSALGVPAVAQESEKTTVKTTTTVIVEDQANLLAPLWRVTDAVPVESGTLDLRAGFWWETGDGAQTLGDGDDDFILTPALVWGVAENFEVSARVPTWWGDSGDRGPFADGNYDTYLGGLWRFREQEGYWPAMALGTDIRVPTGDGSSGVDAELRLVLTNTYDSGIRSHVNIYGASLNGDNDEHVSAELDGDDGGLFGDEGGLDREDIGWGVVFGLDGPLAENLRWVADYEYRSARYKSSDKDVQVAEFGVEWKIDDSNALGVAAQFGVHNTDETPDYGGGVTYSHTLRF